MTDAKITASFGITIVGPIVRLQETDVATLQQLLKDACRAETKVIERLVKARRQRDEARAEVARLRAELTVMQVDVKHGDR